MEGDGHHLFQGTIPAYSWRDWGKQREASVETDGATAEIRSEHLLFMSQTVTTNPLADIDIGDCIPHL
jgi:hypothetical protein